MEAKQGNYEENLTKALMRGVCALNMEAMSVLHTNPAGEENGEMPDPSGGYQKAVQNVNYQNYSNEQNIKPKAGYKFSRDINLTFWCHNTKVITRKYMPKFFVFGFIMNSLGLMVTIVWFSKY